MKCPSQLAACQSALVIGSELFSDLWTTRILACLLEEPLRWSPLHAKLLDQGGERTISTRTLSERLESLVHHKVLSLTDDVYTLVDPETIRPIIDSIMEAGAHHQQKIAAQA